MLDGGGVCIQSDFASHTCKARRIAFAARGICLAMVKRHNSLSCISHEIFIGDLTSSQNVNITRCYGLIFRHPRHRCSRYLHRCPSRHDRYHWHWLPQS